jgi:hypothetical protein
LPLLLARGDAPPQEALATVISRVGALVLTAAELREGEEIELRRPSYGLRAAVRVVAGAGPDPETRLSKYGVEFVAPRPDFWGLVLSGDPDSDDDA